MDTGICSPPLHNGYPCPRWIHFCFCKWYATNVFSLHIAGQRISNIPNPELSFSCIHFPTIAVLSWSPSVYLSFHISAIIWPLVILFGQICSCYLINVTVIWSFFKQILSYYFCCYYLVTFTHITNISWWLLPLLSVKCCSYYPITITGIIWRL